MRHSECNDPAGGSSAGDGTNRSTVAQQVFPSGHATGTKDRQGGDGQAVGSRFVLDVASEMELRAVANVRFARGTAWKSTWCAAITVVMIRRPTPLHRGV